MSNRRFVGWCAALILAGCSAPPPLTVTGELMAGDRTLSLSNTVIGADGYTGMCGVSANVAGETLTFEFTAPSGSPVEFFRFSEPGIRKEITVRVGGEEFTGTCETAGYTIRADADTASVRLTTTCTTRNEGTGNVREIRGVLNITGCESL